MANQSQTPDTDKSNGSSRRTIRSTVAEMYRAAISSSFGGAYRERGLFAAHTGISFEGRRDLYQNLGYQRLLTPQMFRERYERGGITERIVEAYPRATWSSGAMIVEDPAPNVETVFEQEVETLFKRLDVWSLMMRTDILAGLGQYALLLIGAEGDLKTPLPQMRSQEDVLYLQPIPQENAQISSRVKSPEDPRFGDVEFYTVTFETGRSSQVHWTRAVHIAEGTLVDDIYGKPRLRAIWNYLNDLDKVVGGGAEAAWKNMDRGMQLDLDPNVVLNTEGEDALMEEVDEYIQGSRRFMRTRGVKLNQLGADAVGFGPNADTLLMLVSATTGIPHRILTGSERGELASTNDRNNWNDRNAERQTAFAEPATMDFVDRLISVGALPEPAEYDVVWPDFEDMDEQQKSEIADKYANANSKQATAGDTIIVTSNEIRQNLLGLDPLEEVDEDQVDDADDGDDGEDGDDNGENGEDGEEVVDELRAAVDFVDEINPTPEWLAVHWAADKNEPRFERLFTNYWDDARKNIDGGRLVRALESNSVESAADVVYESLDASTLKLDEKLPGYYEQTIADSGTKSAEVVLERGSWYSDGTNPELTELRAAQDETEPLVGVFDSSHEGTIRWAQDRSAALVTEIDPDTRRAIRDVIATGIEEGIAPAKNAQAIRRIVGLRTDQITALENFSQRPGATVANPGRSIVGGKLPTAKQVDLYRAKLLRQRAVLIARSETMRSANQGQTQLWTQAIEAKQLPADQLRIFIATGDDRTRPEHADADGEVTGVYEEFPSGIEPGVPPNCRCAQGLASAADVEAYNERIAA